MKEQTQQGILKTLVNVSRFLLACVFIFSGFVKANDPFGTVFKLQDYTHAFGLMGLPFFTLVIAAVGLAFLEFSLGIHLLFGMSRGTIARITVLFMGIMTLLTAYIFAFNPVSDCGCFGDVLVLSNGQTFLKNIVLLAAAIINQRYHHLYIKIVGNNTQWLVTTFCSIYIVAYSIFCIYALPVLDMSPYKIGTDLKAHDLKTANFYATDARTDDDITDSIVFHRGYTFLLVIPNLRHADEGCIDLVNEAYEYAADNGYAFYCLTGSADPEDWEYWSDHTGAEYKYSLSDEQELKTVVRASPGLLLLKDGVIINKWSNYQLPDEYILTDRLENLEIGQLAEAETHQKVLNILTYFILPLLAFVLIDRIGSGFVMYRHWKRKSKHLLKENDEEETCSDKRGPILPVA